MVLASEALDEIAVVFRLENRNEIEREISGDPDVFTFLFRVALRAIKLTRRLNDLATTRSPDDHDSSP
jgi:hypothetical protein